MGVGSKTTESSSVLRFACSSLREMTNAPLPVLGRHALPPRVPRCRLLPAVPRNRIGWTAGVPIDAGPCRAPSV